MKYYDLSYLISPELSEKEAKDFSQQIADFLPKGGAVLDKGRSPFKMRLAYPIKKKQEAYLTCLNFFATPEKIKSFREKFNAEPKILRFLLFSEKLPKFKVAKKIRELPKVPRQRPLEKKVELKEIEKKLREILGSLPGDEPRRTDPKAKSRSLKDNRI